MIYHIVAAINDRQPGVTTAGSPLWQTIFFCCAVLLILLEVIRGWRLGVMRQLIRVVAVICGYAVAYFGGEMIVPLWTSSIRSARSAVTVAGAVV